MPEKLVVWGNVTRGKQVHRSSSVQGMSSHGKRDALAQPQTRYRDGQANASKRAEVVRERASTCREPKARDQPPSGASRGKEVGSAVRCEGITVPREMCLQCYHVQAIK